MSELKVNSIKGVSASTAAISIDNSSGTCTANITNNLSNRNLIINGAMQVAARGTSFTSAANNTYAADRWLHERSSSAAFTISQSTDAPTGYKNSIKAEVTTADTSNGTTDFNQFLYKIEANDISHLEYGTANAKTCTISFWAKHSVTGTYPLGLQNYNGSRVYPATYTINTANTWEYKTITFAGDTGGSWNTSGNAVGIRFNFCWNMGSNFTGGTVGAWAATTGYANLASTAGPDVNGTVGNTVQWAGVQLEVGSHATDFEHRSYAQELALCQRYYYRTADDGNTTNILSMATEGATVAAGGQPFPTTMRAVPTITFGSGLLFFTIGTSAASFSLNQNRSSTTHLGVYVNISGATAGQAGSIYRNSSNGYIEADAEL